MKHIEELLNKGVDVSKPPETIELKSEYRKTPFMFTAILTGKPEIPKNLPLSIVKLLILPKHPL